MRSSKRLSNKVADAIRQMILDNEISTGEALNEVALAEKLNVSRTPIRESIAMLEQEGLIKVVSGRGAFVAELTISDYMEINELRKILEPIAAVKSMERISDEEIESQIRLWEEIQTKITQGIYLSYNDAAQFDSDLHAMLIDRCNNTRLSHFLWILRRQSLRYLFTVWETKSINEETVREHLEILNALKARDVNRLATTVVDHITISNSYILKMIK